MYELFDMKRTSKKIELPAAVYKLAIYKSLAEAQGNGNLDSKLKSEIHMLKETCELIDDPIALLKQLNLTDKEISLLSFVFEE